ncbi:MAG: hypothetical protein OXT09_15810 [Myxococcales bacterium]|nr:hypothetical protein [Myxococcales bacterium]
MNTESKLWSGILVVYLAACGAVASSTLVRIFPSTRTIVVKRPGPDGKLAEQLEAVQVFEATQVFRFELALTSEQGFLVLALLAGAIGACIHAAQSFTAYVGNRAFRGRWLLWYFFRVPIGALLGLMLYFVVRAGLLGSQTNGVSPHGVVAFASLAGLFSKQAIDKLAEVFETLFRTRDPAPYADRLSQGEGSPVIEAIDPETVPVRAGTNDAVSVRIRGRNFQSNSYAELAGVRLDPNFVDDANLELVLSPDQRPQQEAVVELVIVNPTPSLVRSEPASLRFVLPPSGTPTP